MGVEQEHRPRKCRCGGISDLISLNSGSFESEAYLSARTYISLNCYSPRFSYLKPQSMSDNELLRPPARFRAPFEQSSMQIAISARRTQLLNDTLSPHDLVTHIGDLARFMLEQDTHVALL